MKKFLAVVFLIFFSGTFGSRFSLKPKSAGNLSGLMSVCDIDFTMNDDGDNFTPPSFEGFRVVGRTKPASEPDLGKQ